MPGLQQNRLKGPNPGTFKLKDRTTLASCPPSKTSPMRSSKRSSSTTRHLDEGSPGPWRRPMEKRCRRRRCLGLSAMARPGTARFFRHLSLRGEQLGEKWLHSPARELYAVNSLLFCAFEGWPAVLAACKGTTSLDAVYCDYEVLLSPVLGHLTHLFLEVHGKVEDFLLPKLFMGSTDTLTTLTFHHLTPTPSRAPTIASILDILSHTSFPNMRDLSISAGELGSILPLLPFLLTLQTLTLTRTSFCDCGRPPFRAIGELVSPTLLALNAAEHDRGTMWTFKDLRESLGLPGFQNLRKLSLPQWLVSWVPEGEWSAFAAERDVGFHFGRTTPYGCTPVGRTVIYY